VARRNQVVRHRTRMKNEIHAILAAHLVPPCPHAELFNRPGRVWLDRQALPDDERAAVMRHLREFDRLGEELAVLDRDIAEATVDDPAVRRLLTIAGVNLTVAAGLVAAIGDIRRFPRPQQLVSYFGLNPRVQALLTRNGAAFLAHGGPRGCRARGPEPCEPSVGCNLRVGRSFADRRSLERGALGGRLTPLSDHLDYESCLTARLDVERCAGRVPDRQLENIAFADLDSITIGRY
jgi:hypothetical protein